MENRSDKYLEENEEQKITRSRVSKNTVLYDEINNRIVDDEIHVNDVNMNSENGNKLLDDFYLSDDEVKKLIEKGIIIESILHPKHTSGSSLIYSGWQENGIHKVIYKTPPKYNHPGVLVTDFHLFIINLLDKDNFDIKVISLKDIKSLEVQENITSYTTPIKCREYTVNKNPTKGAVIGAVIAGPTGAIIGAAMNSGSETKMSLVGGTTYSYNWDLYIKFDNDFEYVMKDIDRNYKSYKDAIDLLNKDLDVLVRRSKEKFTDEEKAKIVKDYVTKKRKVGCYVATCIYGSYDCPQVWTLRRYRDYALAKTWYGRAFINVYYIFSPIIVRLFGKTKWFNNMWKPKLDRWVKKLQDKGYESTPYKDKDWK